MIEHLNVHWWDSYTCSRKQCLRTHIGYAQKYDKRQEFSSPLALYCWDKSRLLKVLVNDFHSMLKSRLSFPCNYASFDKKRPSLHNQSSSCFWIIMQSMFESRGIQLFFYKWSCWIALGPDQYESLGICFERSLNDEACSFVVSRQVWPMLWVEWS